MLRGLVFAGSRAIYRYFLHRYNLNPQEYRYVEKESDIQGYHRDSNPKLRLFFVDRYWMNSVSGSDCLASLVKEVYGRVHFGGNLPPPFSLPIEVALLIDKVEEVQYVEELPEYLVHGSEEVREAAGKRYEELGQCCIVEG